MGSRIATNSEIAGVLDRIGDLLEARGENPFRISSYRRAASLVKDSDRSLARLAQEEGILGLTKIRGIGEKLAGVIDEYVSTRKVEIIEELQKKAPGSAPPKHKTVRDSALSVAPTGKSESDSGRAAGRLKFEAAPSRESRDAPPVGVILDVDAEYCRRAEEGSLKRIAPRQHNPKGEAWLPILSTSREDWKFTAMFSNTALAHQLGKTGDWVVVYFRKKGEEERQCTVVTEQRGEMKGKRVIRGREAETQGHYR